MQPLLKSHQSAAPTNCPRDANSLRTAHASSHRPGCSYSQGRIEKPASVANSRHRRTPRNACSRSAPKTHPIGHSVPKLRTHGAERTPVTFQDGYFPPSFPGRERMSDSDDPGTDYDNATLRHD